MKRNFTIDDGVRFYYITPTQSEGDDVAVFGPNVLERQLRRRSSTSRSRPRRAVER